MPGQARIGSRTGSPIRIGRRDQRRESRIPVGVNQFIGVISWALASVALAAPAPNSFAVQGVRIFDGEKSHAHANVVVIDGRVAAVGPGVRIPKDLQIVDGVGKTLLPGFLDAHVHVFPGAQSDALRFGVTTEFDMFNVTHDFEQWRRQRESLGRVTQADTWSAGIGVTVPGGHPVQWVPENMPRLTRDASAGEFVAARIGEGSDYIKLIVEDNAVLDPAHAIPTLTPAQACAVIAAARARGKLTVAHVTSQSNALMAIDCHVHGLAHTFVDGPAGEELLRRAREEGVFFISTLALLASPLEPPATAGAWMSVGQARSLRMSNPLVHPGDFANAVESIRRLHTAGVPVLAGTDAPAPGTAHGITLHRELAILVQSGLTPEEALASATALPARAFGLADRGRVSPGARADLVLVDGDPTVNISDTLRIAMIWKNGYAVDRTAPR